jgi:hypothetical protein
MTVEEIKAYLQKQIEETINTQGQYEAGLSRAYTASLCLLNKWNGK